MRAVQIAGLLAALVSVSPAAAWSGAPNPQCGAATGLACPDKQALEKCIADNAEVTEHDGKVTVKLVNNVRPSLPPRSRVQAVLHTACAMMFLPAHCFITGSYQ